MLRFPIEVIRHSTAHLAAAAVLELYPETKFGIGPVIENGFYYDFDFPPNVKVEPETLKKIEEKMRELIKKNLSFEKKDVSLDEAIKIFKDLKQNYKVELLEDLKKYGTTRMKEIEETEREKGSAEKVSIYTVGKFVDLCRGPHVASTKDLGVFKLQKTAGAYWRGSEKNKMLTRIYGLVFESEKELKDYLKLIEEAEKRDHRVLGEALEFFTISEKVGKGLPLWLPKGAFIRHQIEDYMYKKLRESGYQHVYTPHITKKDLYEMSGHLEHYKEDMYSPIDIEGEEYYLKPMNCPHHHMIYKSKIRSYRELPLRLGEFGTVYRFERSGVLSGLIRVRGFTQEDAHIYCTPDGLADEFVNVLHTFKEVYEDFKITDYYFRLSLPDFSKKEKYGDIEKKELWEKSADQIRKAMKKFGAKYVEVEGEAAFYGPKVDVQVKNVLGKEDSIATIQVDFYMPERFDLTYTDEKGKEKRPFVIHRAILGSFERFFAFLIEKTAGAMPVWLAPVQVKLIPVGSAHGKPAEKLAELFAKENIRAEVDALNETVGYKIRKAEKEKVPYMLVIGDKEAKGKRLVVRFRGQKETEEMAVKKFIERVKTDIEKKN
jgi:threonyl-tRNA synthetase